MMITKIIVSLLFVGQALAQVVIDDRTFSVPNFPCMKCHSEIKTSTPTFPLPKPHEDLKFKHMEDVKNCKLCHDQNDRDKLRLINEKKISFNDSHLLCIQCHGEKGPDFRSGAHGKQVGSWEGVKHRYTCVECHNPHAPKFPQWKADPPPIHPNRKTGAKH
ncbi:MAG: hypothetical protein HOE90_05575 [Bacteriovoracaceae bacterium]|nr:hypothetical protein [Bacteriovoracaceae bacterium]